MGYYRKIYDVVSVIFSIAGIMMVIHMHIVFHDNKAIFVCFAFLLIWGLFYQYCFSAIDKRVEGWEEPVSIPLFIFIAVYYIINWETMKILIKISWKNFTICFITAAIMPILIKWLKNGDD